jgi:hypothetical protein
MCIESVFYWVEAAKVQSNVGAKNSISNHHRKNTNFSSKMQYLINYRVSKKKRYGNSTGCCASKT